MADKEYDIWQEKFDREIGIKASVILFGNTGDLTCGKRSGNVYQGIVPTLVPYLKGKGYKSIIKWDRVDGIENEISKDLPAVENQNPKSGNAYDLGEGLDGFESAGAAPQYKDIDDFFAYLLSVVKNRNKRSAIILDYGDYIFGNANALSEKERNYLTTLGKAIRNAQSDELNGEGNIVIVIAHNLASIPPSFYLGNPLVGTINIPLPGRNERERFVNYHRAELKVKQRFEIDKSGRNLEFDDFIDALDGFTLRDILQIIKLSRQLKNEVLTFEKLINLYKYGEKVSPWEELSADKLAGIEDKLKERVKGQDLAIKKVRDVVIRAFTGFAGLQHSTKQKKPKGTLFFVGPTGVGKTELAKALAEFIFGDENACIRFDMSEYNHEHSDQRLVGAPPGYVGYEAGGQLTNAVKEKPFCVLLFDEIEKADGKILDKFLQILEDGRLTDGKGETVYFAETIIIFTSNIGAATVDANMDPKEAREKFKSAVRDHFTQQLKRPELLNRIGDNIVAFNFIDDPKVFSSIAKSKFKGVIDFVKERYRADLVFDDEEDAFNEIAKASNKQNGGRGMLNVMENKIIDPLSLFIFDNVEYLKGRRIIIKLKRNDKGKPDRFDFDLD